jgi:hypothetical protein
VAAPTLSTIFIRGSRGIDFAALFSERSNRLLAPSHVTRAIHSQSSVYLIDYADEFSDSRRRSLHERFLGPSLGP